MSSINNNQKLNALLLTLVLYMFKYYTCLNTGGTISSFCFCVFKVLVYLVYRGTNYPPADRRLISLSRLLIFQKKVKPPADL